MINIVFPLENAAVFITKSNFLMRCLRGRRLSEGGLLYKRLAEAAALSRGRRLSGGRLSGGGVYQGVAFIRGWRL